MVDSKKDIEVALEISVKGVSSALQNQHPKLAEIFSFIVQELNKHLKDKESN